MSKNENDMLSEALANSLNKGSGEDVAYTGGEKESPSNIDHWVSTGSTILDMLVSNRVDGGLPVGKIVEIHGPQGSGKSLVAAHVLAHTQKMGGVPVYIDTENAVSFDFLEVIGIDQDKEFMYIPEHKLEKIFEIIEQIIAKVREKKSKNDDRFITILVDSIAGATTENEVSGEYDKDGYNTDKAIVLSKAMRKLTSTFGKEQVLLLFTNQVRMNVGGGPFAPEWNVPGGKAIPHHSSVRITMKRTSKIREKMPGGGKEIVGARLKPKIKKNRLAPPKRECEFDLYFDKGIDDLGSIYDWLKGRGIIDSKRGGWCTFKVYGDDDSDKRNEKYSLPGEDEPFKFRSTEWHKTLRENPKFREKVFESVADSVIVDYEKGWATENEIEYVDDDESDDSED